MDLVRFWVRARRNTSLADSPHTQDPKEYLGRSLLVFRRAGRREPALSETLRLARLSAHSLDGSNALFLQTGHRQIEVLPNEEEILVCS